MRTFIDAVPWWSLLLVGAAFLTALTEVAFRLGRRTGPRLSEDAKSHITALLTALLGLLALLLGFSFSITESRFQTRNRLVVEEANAIGTAFLRAGLLPAPHRGEVRKLLRQYVAARLERGRSEEILKALHRSEVLHHQLWRHVAAVADENARSEIVALFVQSVNQVIDLHEDRVAEGIYHRLPLGFLDTLIVVAVFGVAILGYRSGVSGARSLIPTLLVVLAIMLVVSLIVELDRPWTQVFAIDTHALTDVQQTMSGGEWRR